MSTISMCIINPKKESLGINSISWTPSSNHKKKSLYTGHLAWLHENGKAIPVHLRIKNSVNIGQIIAQLPQM